MRKDRVVATYGRHRQRVVAVETWSSREHVFSSSSDSFVSNTNSSTDKHELSSLRDNKENESDVSWLAEKTGGRFARKKTFGGIRAKKKSNAQNVFDISGDSTDKSLHQVGTKQNTRSALKDKSNIETQVKAKPTVSTRQTRSSRKTQATSRKTRKTLGTAAKSNATSQDSAHSSSCDVPSAYNFSDFDKYSLVISDSPPIEMGPAAGTTPDAETPNADSSEAPPRSSALTSTPQGQDKSTKDPKDLRKSLLSHLYQVKGNISSTPKDSVMKGRKTLSKLSSTTPSNNQSSKASQNAHSSTPIERRGMALHSLNESNIMDTDGDDGCAQDYSAALSHMHLSAIRSSPNMSQVSCGSKDESAGLHSPSFYSAKTGQAEVDSVHVDLTRLTEDSIRQLIEQRSKARTGSRSLLSKDNISVNSSIDDEPLNQHRQRSDRKLTNNRRHTGSSVGIRLNEHTIDLTDDSYETCASTMEKRLSAGSQGGTGSFLLGKGACDLKAPPTGIINTTYRVTRSMMNNLSKSNLSRPHGACAHESYDHSMSLFDASHQRSAVLASASRGADQLKKRGISSENSDLCLGHSARNFRQQFSEKMKGSTHAQKSAESPATSSVALSDMSTSVSSHRSSDASLRSTGNDVSDNQSEADDDEDDSALSDIVEDSESDDDIRYQLTNMSLMDTKSPQRTVEYSLDEYQSSADHLKQSSTKCHTRKTTKCQTSAELNSSDQRKSNDNSHLGNGPLNSSHSMCSNSADEFSVDSHKHSHSSVSEETIDYGLDNEDTNCDSTASHYEQAESQLSEMSVYSKPICTRNTRANRILSTEHELIENDNTCESMINSNDTTNANDSSSEDEAGVGSQEGEWSEKSGSESEEDSDLQEYSDHSGESFSSDDGSSHAEGEVTRYEISEAPCQDNHSDDQEDIEHSSKTAARHGSQTINKSPDMQLPHAEVTPFRDVRKSRMNELCNSFQVLTPVRKKSGIELSARDKVLLQCGQTEPIPFSKCFTPTMLRKCVKIGEGVYGEVFKTERNKKPVAMKVIPIEGDFPVNDEPQKSYAAMLPEIVISKELSDMRSRDEDMTSNFVHVRGVSVVKGRYPSQLLKQWDAFHKRKGSENDRPDMFGDDQLYVVFEFEECGSDLESIQLTSLAQARSVLLQVALALAIGESALQLEHRDLHWGNVLVKATRDDTVTFKLGGQPLAVQTCGVKVAIIDFTLSRLYKDGCAVYCDLGEDPTLFIGQGDYQFDIYRMMKEENKNDWQPFRPYTNVLWLHYLADKLIKMKTYPNATSKDHKSLMREFRTFLRDALSYQSALHLITECPFFAT